MTLTTIQFAIVGLGYMLALILFIATAFLAIKFKKEREQYKTAVWLAADMAYRKEPFHKVYGMIECYMPKCDKAHFKRNFTEKSNEDSN